MAGHASLCRWHSSRRRTLHRSVAVTAIQSKLPHVMLVAERHRLILRHIHFRNVWRGRKLVDRPGERNQQKRRAIDAHTRDRIRAPMKYLGHKTQRALQSIRNATSL